MGKFFAVFKREYLERVRSRWFVITTLFGPLLFGALFTGQAFLSMRSLRETKIGKILILDVSQMRFGNTLRAQLLGPLADTLGITVRELTPSQLAAAETTATHAVMRNDLAGYLVVDSATVAGAKARYAGRDASSLGETELIQNAIRQTVLAQRLENAGLDPRKVEEMTRVHVSLATERITDKGRSGSAAAAAIMGFALAFLLYVAIVLYGQNTLRSVIEEKSTRVAEVVIASVTTDTLLAGKVLGVSAVGLTQQLVWAAGAGIFYEFRAPIFMKLGIGAAAAVSLPPISVGMFVVFLSFFLLGSLFYYSLFAAAGATVNSDQDAQQAAMPIIGLVVASIIFAQPILLDPSSTLSKVMSRLPFSAPILMPLRMSVVSVSPLELGLVLLGLAAASAAAIWVSSKIYRVGLLMYGKRPTFKELGRWISES